MVDIETSLVRANDFYDTEAVTCEVEEGEIIGAKVPSRFYVSFKSYDSLKSDFFFSAKYSDANYETTLANRRCSDQGQSVFDTAYLTQDQLLIAVST